MGWLMYIVTWRDDSRRGFELEIGFIDHFNTQLVIKFNYRAIADFHTLLSLFQPTVSSLINAWYWLLTMASPVLPGWSPLWTAAFQLSLFFTDSRTERLGSSQSESHIATDSRSVSKSWCRATSGAHDKIFITVWKLRSCFRWKSSLMRGRVCLLCMLLALGRPYFTVSGLRLPFS
jgi:hypothetical protein